MYSTFDERYDCYKRVCGTEIKEAYDKLKYRYNCNFANILPSGLAGVYITLKTLCEIHKNGVYLISDELYIPTEKVIKKISSEYDSIKIIRFSPYDTDKLKIIIRENNDHIKCFYAESATNPKGYIVDWSILKMLNTKCKIIIDNAWLSSLLFNPFSVGAHIVLESLGKYVTNGKCIAGAIMSVDKEYYEKINENIDIMGLHVSPHTCNIISQYIDKLEITFKKITRRTIIINNFLKKHKYVNSIYHSMNDDHISNNLFKQYITKQYTYGVIYFNVKCEEKYNGEFIRELIETNGIIYQNSYGKEHDLINQLPYRDENGYWFRLSIGSNNDKYILKKLNNLFISMNSGK